MTILIAGGDSFTYGNELSDCTSNRASINTWSSLLADKLGMSYDCTAWGGDGNSAIARKTMTACSKHLAQGHDITVAVMWSFPGRYEFRFAYNTKERHSPWYTITPWTHETNTNIVIEAFKNFSDNMFSHYENNRSTAEQTGIAKFSKTYYDHVGSDEYWSTYNYVKEIVLLQDWLKLRDIPYIFTFVDNIVFEKQDLDSILKALYDSLDYSRLLPDLGFYSWAHQEKFPFGATHPLEPAHSAFVNKILAFATQKLK